MKNASQKTKLSIFIKMASLYLACFFFSLMLAAIFTILSASQIKKYELQKAAIYAKNAQYPLKVSSTLILNSSNVFEAWQEGLQVIQEASTLQEVAQQSLQSFSSGEATIITHDTLTLLKETNYSIQNLNSLLQKSLALRTLFGQSAIRQTQTISLQLPQILELLELVNNNDINWVVLLNNSDELRASGGFMGSLAALATNKGTLQEAPKFYDIYDLSNRIERVEEVPIGVRKYLSEGRGLALTDANWEADFTQSAPVILSFIDQSELPTTDVLVNINLNLIQDLLKITGPIQLIDSQKTVTSQNLSTLAREDRLNFFSGDKQKKMFLTQLYQSLIEQLPKLDQGQQFRLLQLLATSFDQKQLIFYSPDQNTQQIFSKLGVTGAINYQTDYVLYLLESNVGINKANQGISRQINLKFQPTSLLIELNYENSNLPLSDNEKELIRSNPDLKQADHLGYVNYQRLIIDLAIDQTQIICNGEAINPDEISSITTQQGKATQIGFLFTVTEQSKTSCIITIQPKTPLRSNQSWTIIKQPGLPITSYQLTYFGKDEVFHLDQDKIIGEI